MKSVTTSAPGKLMLFGEHAVVYDRPCLVTAVDQRMYATVEVLDMQELQLEAPDVKVTGYRKPLRELGKGDIPKGAKFIEFALKTISEKHPFVTGCKITTISEFSAQFGFGSSSASTVCTIKAISELMDFHLTERDIFDLAYKTVINVQGKGSGFDVAAGVYGGTLHFVTGGKFIEPLTLKTLPLLVGYSGVKADTVTLVNQVQALANKYPEVIEHIYDDIEELVLLAKEVLRTHNWQALGDLMNLNQGYLAALGVSTRKLANMLYSARDAGAYGAKLSGAGGGDCIIAVAADEKRDAVIYAITEAGGQVIPVKTNAQGVRVESST
jgi:mevalonate kinase